MIVPIWLTVVFGIFFSDLNGDIEFKCEINRIKMQNYRCDKMTHRQKDRYREVNRKMAAANRLKKKIEESVRKQNDRDRQQKRWLLKKIPNSPSKFRKIVQTVVKVAERSPKKMLILQDVVLTFKSVASTVRNRSSRVSVLQLQFLKQRNRVKEHSDSIRNLLKEYGSMRKCSFHLAVPYKTLHRLCQPPVVRKKETKQVWTDIKKFYNSDVVSHKLPSVRCKGRRFLTLSLEECFSMYKEGCINEGKSNVSFSTFCRLRPKSVFKVGQTPDRQCICEQCENFRLVKNHLIKLGVRGIPAHRTDCVKLSLCQIDSDDSCDSQNNRIDSFHQINPDYGKVQCITRNCLDCSVDKVQLKILEENPNLYDDVNTIQWN